ncbi:MAG: AmmeMemoRadiSam system radical SAM enzyme [Spirochaetales bacterium]|nr:AmmeMemoRadiSam system radical SAM enzyme [Spirochaetales bacterium]
MEPRYYESLEDKELRCGLCPHRCRIAAGHHGLCRVRYNQGGELVLPYYGKLTAISIDPIEKKPLYHFHPGQSILSVGFAGCSFRCPFCQNYRISQETTAPTETVSPEALVRIAERERSFGIAYTYSEPLVHLEYVLDTARLARERGLKNVLVSNGFVNPGPAEELLPLIDAANIDFKSADPEFYRREIGGDLEEVKRFLTQACGRLSLEVTTLIIPTKNDTPEEMHTLAGFLASLSPDIPYHLSAYHPQYRYSIPPTPASTLRSLAKVAQEHLRYVYLGNLGGEQSDTVCPGCGALLVARRGYAVTVRGVQDGRCAACGADVPITGV